MGFNKVYRSLQDVFPQIDARVLRAVAIEHSKDADAAVETVLTEIIPFFNERSRPSTPLICGEFVGERSRPSTPLTGGELLAVRSRPSTPLTGGELLGVSSRPSTPLTGVELLVESSRPSTPVTGSEPIRESSAAFAGATSTLQPVEVPFLNSMDSTEDQNTCNITADGEESFRDADDGHKEPVYDTYGGHLEGECVAADRDNVNAFKIELSVPCETNESITADRCTENGIKVTPDDIPCKTLGTLQVVDVQIGENLNPFQERVEYDHLETGLSTTVGKENEQEKLLADASSSVVSSASVTLDEQSMMSSESSVQFVVLNDKHGSNTKELDTILLNDASQIECGSDTAGTEDANLNESMSQASQAHLIEVLEQAIGDARCNKKILFSTMQSVISLMREVELKEEAAEQSKVEAAMGGSDALAKVEELKQMIQQAKEANSMLAGEVHGEKSILASELRELQSRVLSLSEDRDESLVVLDEMRHALEVRLDEAENEIKSAEQRKVEKEKAAMEALADEELIMEKVVEEAKMLKQQAEDNAKLQEFLMDRGQIVDMLQGEIAVICQDVRLLKNKFDEHVPFSKSLFSSQTGRMLVSSTSSSNGMNVNLLKENFDEHLPLSKLLSSSRTSSISASFTSSSGQTSNKVDSVSNRASGPLETEKRDRFNELAFIGKPVKDVNDAADLEEGWELFDSSEVHI